jgi:hypothetical protein
MADVDIATPPPPAPTTDRLDRGVATPVFSAAWFAVLALSGLFALIDFRLAFALGIGYAGLVGVGSAVVVFIPNLTAIWRVTLSFALSVSGLILVSLAMAEGKWWHPVPVAIVLGAAASAAHLRVLVRNRGWAAQARRDLRRVTTSQPALNPALLVLVLLAVVTCLSTAMGDSSNQAGYGGLLRSINPLWFLGVGVLVVVAAWSAMSERPVLPPALMVSTVGLVLTLTPAIVYQAPRSQSAEKHIAIVELIQHGHGLTSSYAIYNDWGGFFSWIAWLDGVARIDSPLVLATYWPALMMLFTVPAMYCLASSLLPNDRLRWTAVLVAILANSIGSDYFSPQSIGFVLALVVFALATSTLPRRLTLPLTVVLAAALAPTHQLSPYLLCGALFWLTIFRVVKSWWLLAAAAVPTLAWTALNHSALGGYISFAGIGHSSNFTLPSQRAGVAQQFIVKEAILATAAAIFLLVVGGAYVVLRRRTKANWGVAITSGVGLGVVAVNAYGNEGIFRAVLFAIPWLAILFVRALADVPARIRPGASVVACVLLAGAYLVGALSLDGGTVIRKTDLTVLDKIVKYADDHPHRIVLAVSMNAGDLPIADPTVPDNMAYFSLKPIVSSARHPTPKSLDAGMVKTTRHMQRLPYGRKSTTDIFVIYSPAAAVHDQQYGYATPETQKLVLQAFGYSPMWREWTHSGASEVLKLNRIAAVRP